ncbi:hypothetical protein [Actinacidiphila sp. ITFR-21]|uniref:hypothetical protein n=1 Tax=Actinacidiphila sp. ITFR-21 TaxID=3075199 RepID=UPI00288ABFB5|nr:hypothetical protein [Streptomyces sp. ITFR-21]WNI16221.1 hypothetical protein RLT57_12230 [Streptomyces sp. ITFR-21]
MANIRITGPAGSVQITGDVSGDFTYTAGSTTSTGTDNADQVHYGTGDNIGGDRQIHYGTGDNVTSR